MTETDVVFDYEALTKENAHASFLPPSKDLQNHPGFASSLNMFLRSIIPSLRPKSKSDGIGSKRKNIKDFPYSERCK